MHYSSKSLADNQARDWQAAVQSASLVSVELQNEGCVAIRCSAEVLNRMCAGQGAIVTELTVRARFPGPESTSCSGIPRLKIFTVYHALFISYWQALGSTFP